MAGDTSRILIPLSIPFFSFIFWFLKRKALKSVASKTVQVEEDLVPTQFEKEFLELDPMKLKNSEENRQDRSDTTMQLKENPTSPASNADDVAQQNGSSPGVKKTQSHEKSHTCRPTDYISNGSLLDNGAELAVAFENIDLSTNGSTGDELLNAINKSASEMDNDTNCVIPAIENTSHQQNGECDNIAETNSPSDDEVDPCKRTDSHESLLPVDCVDAQEDPSSTAATYCDSVISNDSGRGGSETHFEPLSLYLESSSNVLNYAFEISHEYVGRLIGKNGSTVKSIKNQTNADICVKRNPSSRDSKMCLVTGTEAEINSALILIRRKFPIEKYPSVTLSQICFLPFMPCPENLMLRLPESTSVDVILASTVSAGHFFVQQPTHPTFYSLIDLSHSMTHLYNNDVNAPALPQMEKGYICAVYMHDKWYRAEIDEVNPDTDECRIKFLDFGGYAEVSRSALRQINYQFMNVPFQAIECYLAHISPCEGETEFSQEATDYFEQLSRDQLLHAFIIAYADNGIPFVQLYKITGTTMVDINRELINSGLVRSIEPQPELVL